MCAKRRAHLTDCMLGMAPRDMSGLTRNDTNRAETWHRGTRALSDGGHTQPRHAAFCSTLAPAVSSLSHFFSHALPRRPNPPQPQSQRVNNTPKGTSLR